MRQIVEVRLWGVIQNPRLLMTNKAGHMWYVVHVRDMRTNEMETKYIEAVDEMDAYNQAKKELAEEEDREREQSSKTT